MTESQADIGTVLFFASQQAAKASMTADQLARVIQAGFCAADALAVNREDETFKSACYRIAVRVEALGISGADMICMFDIGLRAHQALLGVSRVSEFCETASPKRDP